MFNQLLYKPFAIYPPAINSVYNAIQSISDRVLAGPVEDGERSGLPVKKLYNAAVIQSKGVIIKEAGWLSDYGFTGLREVGEALQLAAYDDAIEQIIWIVDSPGGSVDGLSDFADIVSEVAAKKPVTVQVDGMLASAALYMTSGATAIYANKRDMIGSIGTRIQLFDYSEYAKKSGIKSIVVDTGEHKSAGAFGEEITENQVAEFQRIVDGYFNDFREQVLNNRPIREKTFDELADGRVFFANEEPVESGLIDGIRSVQQTVMQAIEPAMLSKKKHAQARLNFLDF